MDKSFLLYLFFAATLVASLLTPSVLYAGPSISPTTITFSSITLGSATAMAVPTITVSNNGHQGISILQVASSSPTFVVSGPTLPLTLSGHSSATFAVSFVPTTPGTFTGTISFTTNFKNNSTLTASVSGTANAVPTTQTYLLSPSTTSLPFGQVLYSALACFRRGMSGSASFHSERKS